MIRLLAILLSTAVMCGLVYLLGAVALLGMPLIVLAILYGEMSDHHGDRPLSAAKSTDPNSDF